MKILSVLIAALVCTILFSGCSSQVPEPPATTPATPMAEETVETPPTTTYSLIPDPTDVIPPIYSVNIQVSKNTISTDPSITISFRGGQGLGFVESMDATVIRSDGQVETQSIESPQIGSEIVLEGTTHTDRVIVFVTIDTGKTYKAIDQDMPFQPINPS